MDEELKQKFAPWKNRSKAWRAECDLRATLLRLDWLNNPYDRFLLARLTYAHLDYEFRQRSGSRVAQYATFQEFEQIVNAALGSYCQYFRDRIDKEIAPKSPEGAVLR